MTIALPIRAPITSPISRANRIRSGTFPAGLLQVLSNPAEWKCAATVALVFFVASLALAPALTRDQRKLASEINAKTLKAAAAIRVSPRPPLRVPN
jgi:hypothetical protein